MSGRTAWRGQPVLLLLALVAGWLAVRVAVWQSPFPPPGESVSRAAIERVVAPLVRMAPKADPELVPLEPPVRPAPLASPAPLPIEPLRLEPLEPSAPPPPGWAFAAEPPPAAPMLSPRLAGGHTLLLVAAFAAFEVPPELAALIMRGRATPAAVPAFPQLAGDAARPSERRWSGDSWLLLRRDTTTPLTAGRGSYGRSHVGTVLRYRLAPASGHRPAAYLRASMALAGPRETELALGLSGRPVPGVPLAVAAEVRAARFGEQLEARPAVFAYSEFPPLKLPFGTRGEAYLQGGYVGGRFATGFVDGQVRIDRQVARLGPAELRAGAGAWGGAQKGVRRLDVGPGATVAVELGGAPVRMSADWRLRVAGEAAPTSGPALTVSTGF